MNIAQAYADTRSRLSSLLAGLTDEQASVPVPTCPEWTVHDVLAHVAGVCTDVMAGNVEGVASDPWTAAQVEARRDRTVAELLEEWATSAPPVEAMAEHFPGRMGPQWVLDVTTHEHDVRLALGAPGGRDAVGVTIGADFLATVGLHSAVSARGLAPIEVRAGDHTWVVGTGETAVADDDETMRRDADTRARTALLTPSEAPPPGDPAGTLTLPTFELFRAATGRRSLDQIRAYDWGVDPEPYLPIFSFGPFRVSAVAIEE